MKKSKSPPTIDNSSPDDLLAAATKLQREGNLVEAGEIYEKIIERDGDNPSALHNYGVLKAQLGQHEQAIGFFDRTLSVNPDHVNALNNKANSCQELNRIEQAIEIYDECLRLRPDLPEIHTNKGDVLKRVGRLDEAAASYRNALNFDTDFYRALFNLALVLNSLDQQQEALKLLQKTFELNFSNRTGKSDPEAFTHTTKTKLSHDTEQFQYLSSKKESQERFRELADIYQKLENDIDWPIDNSERVPFSPAQLEVIGESYNRPLQLLETPQVQGSSVNQKLNFAQITHRYQEHPLGMAPIDDLLQPEALDALQCHLLESTIWFDFKHIGGHVAAYLENGLACPLILQIAEDLRQSFPNIIKGDALTQIWAFKNVGRQQKIDIHVDDGAVSVNFWITPDGANKDQESGGLMVHEFEAPAEWRINKYDQDIVVLRKSLAQQDVKKTLIPYRQNRAVMFNSALYHESEVAEFAPGYENHRINMTFLFGARPL